MVKSSLQRIRGSDLSPALCVHTNIPNPKPVKVVQFLIERQLRFLVLLLGAIWPLHSQPCTLPALLPCFASVFMSIHVILFSTCVHLRSGLRAYTFLCVHCAVKRPNLVGWKNNQTDHPKSNRDSYNIMYNIWCIYIYMLYVYI